MRIDTRGLQERERLRIIVALEVSFDFSREAEHWAYEALVANCLQRFEDRFRWGAEVSRARASFGFVDKDDALSFCTMCGRPVAESQIAWAPR